MSPKILEILTVSKWRRARDWLILWSRDLLFARVFFAPNRHLESGDGPGYEVTPPLYHTGEILQKFSYLNHPKKYDVISSKKITAINKSTSFFPSIHSLIGSKPIIITLWKHRKLLRAVIS